MIRLLKNHACINVQIPLEIRTILNIIAKSKNSTLSQLVTSLFMKNEEVQAELKHRRIQKNKGGCNE